MAISSPHITTGDIKPRPLIIGHRGSVESAPENTLASYKAAIALGVYAIEIDVQISIDGIPFIMHDTTLIRTTNVIDIFPNMTKKEAEQFSIADLEKLDAGSWFSSLFKGEKVPKLLDVLSLVNNSTNNNVKIFFDLKWPVSTHPFASQYLDIVRANIKQFPSLEGRIIFPVYNVSYIAIFREETPNITLAAQSMFTLDQMIANNLTYRIQQYDMLDSVTTEYLTKVKLITWTVNVDWLFDQLWLLGTNIIITNRVAELSSRTTPMYIPQFYFFLLVITIEIFVFLLLFAIVAKNRHKKEKEFGLLSSTDEKK